MKTPLFLGLFAVLAAGLFATPLAAQPEVPHPEHPRPDFQRPAWLNLNGPWQFDFDPRDLGEREQWYIPGRRGLGRQIVVPFPWESRLSGIHDTQYKGVVWYSRRVTVPSGEPWTRRDPWLIIGACDFQAKVWVNGTFAAEYTAQAGARNPIEPPRRLIAGKNGTTDSSSAGLCPQPKDEEN